MDAHKEFLKTAEQVSVNLENIEIISNSWQEEEFLHSDSAVMDQLNGDPSRGKKVTDYNPNTLRFKVPFKDKILEFDETIDMEKTTLEMKLALKGSTILYVNPNNTKEHFLDLEFLK